MDVRTQADHPADGVDTAPSSPGSGNCGDRKMTAVAAATALDQANAVGDDRRATMAVEESEAAAASAAAPKDAPLVGDRTQERSNRWEFAVKVKPEYVLGERAKCLTPMDKEQPDGAEAGTSAPAPGGGGRGGRDDPNNNNEGGDRSDNNRNGNKNNGRSGRNKKNRGRNRKRPRDAKVASCSDQICLPLLMGDPCPYGVDKCRYKHDIGSLLADRPDDIVSELGGVCPVYATRGVCRYGILCRFGRDHIDLKTGENLVRKETIERAEKGRSMHEVKNILRREVQLQLWKNRYPFKCKRQFSKNRKGGGKRNKAGRDGENRERRQGSENQQGGLAKEGAVEGALKMEGATDSEVGGKEAVEVGEPCTEGKSKESAAVTMKAEDGKDVKEEGNKAASVDNQPEEADAKGDVLATEAIRAAEADINPTTTTETPKSEPALREDAAAAISEKDKNGGSATTTGTAAMDLSPLPTRERRKLIDFSNKVYVAPLTTVGNLPFRRIVKRYGADITCGEMALATCLLEGKPSEWALLKRHPSEDVFGIQIAGGFPDQITRACELIEAEVEADFVDLNLGCPIDLICERSAGAALMMREKKLKECVEAMSRTLSCPITIKMRTGWDERQPFAHSLVPKVQRWGIDGLSAIMIHGRSRLQRYTKLADWDYVEQVANSQSPELPHIPVIGNGDIFSYTDYEKHVLAKPGLSHTAMLARGALVKPWLPTEIKESRHWDISASERLDMLKDFTKFGLEHWGSDQKGVNNTRRFLLEFLSFLYRYVPVGMLEVLPQQMNQRPPIHMCGRSDLETLMLSHHCADWIKISEMLLGPVPDRFQFEPKHKANGYKD